MTQFKRQILAVLAAGSLFVTPAYAATSLEISGNGSKSDNDVEIERSTQTTVVQSNKAVVNNNVSSSASTGGNTANDNTGGDVMIRTGNASSDTTVMNTLNSNSADVNCCEEGDVDVLISGNGSYSDNKAEVKTGRHDATEIFQENDAYVRNNVDADARTGENDAKRNTGGDVTVKTGDASATVNVSTTANANRATVGGEGGESWLGARIVGNGSDSDNDIRLDLGREISIVQENDAHVKNDVDAYAKTGFNDANDNTGGEVLIWTGDADTEVAVDNMVNFNAADVDCGCFYDVDAKVAGNGYDSDNNIKAAFGDDLEVFQGGREGDGNTAYLDNYVDGYAKTGWNAADYNTGYDGADPYVLTGDATSTTEVSNTGNVNVFGGAHDWDLPEVDVHFNVSLSMAQLMALLGL